ncbi:Atu1372/SO_1960 family protein [Tenacibaculum ovolyticum]|uniref:Atu1372/SO_1960 family protein n=1 Tax=Tenacibaculum ovolyticum TaxID=104270 RepID=UPI0021D40A20|nr:Atu1372/SO_1960 family protein [Tenacibaculum ovolyticum]
MESHKEFISMAIEVAKSAKAKGNLPYGCVLVDETGEVIFKGENTINSDHDMLAHAEINILREAGKTYSHEELKSFTIYTSDEPCPMCASAIYWSGVGKLVYGLSKTEYYKIVGKKNPDWVFEMSARDVLSQGGRKVEVIGPIQEKEAAKLHKNLTMKINEKIKALGLELPSVSEPGGNYVSVNVRENIAYVAIQFPINNGEYLYQGRLGDAISTIQGYEAMKLSALNVIAQIESKIGFENVIGLNHIDAYFQSGKNWDESPEVVNGASDLFVNVLGDKGKHSRAIFGVDVLPRNFSVGLTASFTIK